MQINSPKYLWNPASPLAPTTMLSWVVSNFPLGHCCSHVTCTAATLAPSEFSSIFLPVILFLGKTLKFFTCTTHIKITSTVDPWTQGLGAPTLHGDGNLCMVYGPSSIYTRYQRTCSSAFADSTNCRQSSIVVFTIEKNPCISGPVQFKPMLFRGQLFSWTRHLF